MNISNTSDFSTLHYFPASFLNFSGPSPVKSCQCFQNQLGQAQW